MQQPDTGTVIPSAQIRAIEDPSNILGTPAPSWNPRLISVTFEKKSGMLIFQEYRPDSRKPIINRGRKERPQQSFIDRLNEEIAALFASVAPRGYDECQEAAEAQEIAISSAGQRYFRELIPPELAEELRDWEDGTCVEISTEEGWIPWELLHDGQDFLGRRFLLFRLPRPENDDDDDGTNDNSALPRPIEDGSAGFIKVVHVIGGNLGGNYAADTAPTL